VTSCLRRGCEAGGPRVVGVGLPYGPAKRASSQAVGLLTMAKSRRVMWGKPAAAARAHPHDTRKGGT